MPTIGEVMSGAEPAEAGSHRPAALIVARQVPIAGTTNGVGCHIWFSLNDRKG